MSKSSIILFGILIYSLTSFGQTKYYLDETSTASSFQVFVTELTDIVAKRDTTRLFPILADSIFESNDGCGYSDKKCFIDILRLRRWGDSSTFWTEAEKLLKFGFHTGHVTYGHWENNDRSLPIFQAPSFTDLITYRRGITNLFIHAENVNIRSRPTIKSKVIAQISHDTLVYNAGFDIYDFKWPHNYYNWNPDENGFIWIQVRLKDGRFGYVVMRYTSLWLDREMTITRINGEWRIVSFWMASGC